MKIVTNTDTLKTVKLCDLKAGDVFSTKFTDPQFYLVIKCRGIVTNSERHENPVGVLPLGHHYNTFNPYIIDGNLDVFKWDATLNLKLSD